ncbi:MAG: DUF6165 family protein [Pseudomonadota bacterium]
MSGTVTIEIAPGELIDKITILEIKTENITDPDKLKNVQIELQTLQTSRDAAIAPSSEMSRLTDDLKFVNQQLWTIEDDIRDCERAGDFGDRFIKLARSVYKTNDRRAALKREINVVLGSRLVEEKSYQPY